MIQKGQKVHCILYGGKDGIIFEIHGEQHPETIKTLGGGCMVMGGSASFDIVFEDHISRGVPESIVHGVQWRIYDEIATEDEIKAALEAAGKATADRGAAAKAQAEAKQKEIEELPGRFPYLIPKSKAGGLSDAALGAKNMKAELSKAFPGVKFSTRSEYYSGGNAIRVSWTDGPTEEEVKTISDKYQECSFDGMTDSTIYLDTAWPEAFGGANYVTESRHESPELIRRAAAQDWSVGVEVTEKGEIIGLTQAQKMDVYRTARKMSAIPEIKANPGNGNGHGPVSEKTVRENKEKNGVEILFPAKPAAEVLDKLKANGWRWSRFAGLWYNRNTPENLEFAKGL
jgi:hypothetical protein